MDIGLFETETSSPALEFECMLDAGDFRKEWVRCSMAANYIAAYTAYQFIRREWAENLISTVANDFLEAVIRLSPDRNGVTIRCVQYTDTLLLEVKHGLRPEMVQPFRSFLTQVCARDINDLYFQLLTAAERPAPAFNQLGLVMLVHDFGARLAARVDERDGVVATRVFIPTKELTA
jgi:hypothetical protein